MAMLAAHAATPIVRHAGGAAVEAPAHLVQRVCGTGIEALMVWRPSSVATAHRLRGQKWRCASAPLRSIIDAAIPVAAFTHRNGFRMGQDANSRIFVGGAAGPGSRRRHRWGGAPRKEPAWRGSIRLPVPRWTRSPRAVLLVPWRRRKAVFWTAKSSRSAAACKSLNREEGLPARAASGAGSQDRRGAHLVLRIVRPSPVAALKPATGVEPVPFLGGVQTAGQQFGGGGWRAPPALSALARLPGAAAGKQPVLA